ncbi:hypothetical protein ASF84_19060 [Pseudomonas sp. Leaf127]|uniref:hypothetical protein n=1 Tax=Pseudomonas sp. Leaf127 TaxID=1736267 RepID=UPI000702F69C|nr:hypothetical protein [Pseudomonas sp. Leaf127]KQQ53902.1 hypothetical protein ASF84_19060 [Pseudomonas sp. Leaf127]
MSKRRILTIGLDLATDDTEYVEFSSKISLLDWDIVLFKPEIDEFVHGHARSYQGRPRLDDVKSFQLKESCEHWRREIKQAVEAGKTVFVFLPIPLEVYVDTGGRQYSGTGRNQKTTVLVEPYSNYEALPMNIPKVVASGSSIKLSPKCGDIVAAYWAQFESLSTYHITMSGSEVPACLTTKAGDKPVGAIYRMGASHGTLLLLPDLDFYDQTYMLEDDECSWSKEGEQFASRMMACVVGIDKVLRSRSEKTPEPKWASELEFVLTAELELRVKLLHAESLLEEAQKNKEVIVNSLVKAGSLRALLFEKGKALEFAIIDALRLLGFTVSNFQNAESEFDVVFECDQGRLVGEAEGKDTKAVNIEKLRQLAMNIHEDLARDEVSMPAKPVLFGNGYRLLALHERADPFTTKCHSAAASSSTALVFTPDLFAVAKYIHSATDPAYARLCREAILSSAGRVIFPIVPALDDASEVTSFVQEPAS